MKSGRRFRCRLPRNNSVQAGQGNVCVVSNDQTDHVCLVEIDLETRRINS